MRPTLHRRFHVNTTLSSRSTIRRRRLINIFSHQRPVHSSRNNTITRRPLRHLLSRTFKLIIRHANHLIRSRSQNITRSHTHSHRTLTLTAKRRHTTLTSQNIRSLQRHTSRIRHIHHLNNNSSHLTTHPILTHMNSIIHRNIIRRSNILTSRNSLTTRINRPSPSSQHSVRRSPTTIQLMRTQRRPSRQKLTTTKTTSSHSSPTKFNRRQSTPRH